MDFLATLNKSHYSLYFLKIPLSHFLFLHRNIINKGLFKEKSSSKMVLLGIGKFPFLYIHALSFIDWIFPDLPLLQFLVFVLVIIFFHFTQFVFFSFHQYFVHYTLQKQFVTIITYFLTVRHSHINVLSLFPNSPLMVTPFLT